MAIPKKLYKYRPFDVRVLRAITEAEIYYARPKQFNDPLDCDPSIEVDSSRRRLEALVYQIIAKQNITKAQVAIDQYRYLATEDDGDWRIQDSDAENYLKRQLAGRLKSELDQEFGDLGVLSLSEVWASALMWSHYGDEHRGLCIEYDTTDQLHPNLKQVSYKAPRAVKTSDMLRWKLKNDYAAKNRIRDTYFYAKSPEWKYEKEWRVVYAHQGVIELPFRVSAIIFGLRCDPAVIMTVGKLLSHRRDIKLWQIESRDDTFALKRRLLDRDELESRDIREPGFLAFNDIILEDYDEDDEEEFELVDDEDNANRRY
jgi:hypothetical protein